MAWYDVPEGEGVVIRKKTVTLTNAEILTLPTTPVEIIPAVPDKEIFILGGVMRINRAIDSAYGNVGAVIIPRIAANPIVNYADAGGFFTGVNGVTPDIYSIKWVSRECFFQAGAAEVTDMGTTFSNNGVMITGSEVNTPVNLGVDNFTVGYGEDLGNFTGGDASSNLRVTVLYALIDVS